MLAVQPQLAVMRRLGERRTGPSKVTRLERVHQPGSSMQVSV